MATPRPPVEAAERLYTAADLAAMPSELPSGPVRLELDNGRLVSMTPPGDAHGAVESNLSAALKVQGEWAGYGKVRCGEVGVVLWRNPDRVVGVDVLFVANRSLPIRRSPEGYLETIPDLAVEVVSKNDPKPYLERKVADYLAAGVRVVWIVDSRKQRVTEYRAGSTREYGAGDVLTVEDLIPGFAFSVAGALRE